MWQKELHIFEVMELKIITSRVIIRDYLGGHNLITYLTRRQTFLAIVRKREGEIQ